MKAEIIESLVNNFEAYAQKTDEGLEFWLARDLQQLLGYGEWRNFFNTILKAKLSCETSNNKVSDHFVDVNKTIKMPKGDSALFGHSTQEMKLKWAVTKSRALADFAPTIILDLFRNIVSKRQVA